MHMQHTLGDLQQEVADAESGQAASKQAYEAAFQEAARAVSDIAKDLCRAMPGLETQNRADIEEAGCAFMEPDALLQLQVLSITFWLPPWQLYANSSSLEIHVLSCPIHPP